MGAAFLAAVGAARPAATRLAANRLRNQEFWRETGSHLGKVTTVHCDKSWPALMSFHPMHKHHSSARITATVPIVRNTASKRRSNRMALNAAVALSGHDRHKAAFRITTKATNLNKHGAAVQLDRELPVGSTVVLRNKLGSEVSARVVAQISAVEGLRTYGVEFVDLDERAKQFWGISFPTT